MTKKADVKKDNHSCYSKTNLRLMTYDLRLFQCHPVWVKNKVYQSLTVSHYSKINLRLTTYDFRLTIKKSTFSLKENVFKDKSRYSLFQVGEAIEQLFRLVLERYFGFQRDLFHGHTIPK